MGYLEFFLRLLLSMFLGLIIGLERQLTGHPAGIRINILICMGSCLFTLCPEIYAPDQVFRVGAAIISGVGFLCSAVIFKENGSVKGMNTAATLWCTSAIGILASTLACWWAIIATIILISSNLVLRPLARKITPFSHQDETETRYRISITCQENAEWEIRQLLIYANPSKTLFLSNIESGDVVGDKVEVIAEFCSTGKSKNHVLEGIVGRALKNESVVSAGWEIL